MFIQPDFPENPFSLVVSEQNKQFARLLQDNGADAAHVRKTLTRFYSVNLVLRELSKSAKNPEWLDFLAQRKVIGRRYETAIRSLETLLADASIPAREKPTIEKDIAYLRERKVFQTFFALGPEPVMEPKPTSVHQMIGFQAWALYEYLKPFKCDRTHTELYDFMAELLRNLYKGTAITGLQGMTGALLKKNYVDNIDKLHAHKYDKLDTEVSSRS